MKQTELFAVHRVGEYHRLVADLPPYATGSETSYEAAKAIKPHETTQMEQVFDCIKTHGPVTRKEIGNIMGLSGDSVRPRVNRLLGEDRRYLKDPARIERCGKKIINGMGYDLLRVKE